jgi:G patch domain-containing protein 1
MTSRLKHKLELENVNLKSAYINESFVQVRLLLQTFHGADL